MEPGTNLRKTVFWTIDRLAGGPVLKQYRDVVRKEASDYQAWQELTDILTYAKEHVPFYKEIAGPELKAFPVMNKSIYKKNGTDCFSDEYHDRSSLHKVSTSGSTGEPMLVYQNAEKRNRVKADLIRAHERLGWEIGMKYVFLRNWVANYRQPFFKNIAQNVYPISIAEFNAAKKDALTSFLAGNPGTVLFGYSSAICDYMQHLKKTKSNAEELNVRLIVCDSDELSFKNQKLLKDFFGCDVINRYDNEENGLIAYTDIETNRLRVNTQGLFIELLERDADIPAKPGQMGRVVITDLYNHAMPLVRYDTGDYAISDDVGYIRSFREISGRQSACLVSANDTIVSATAVSGLTEVFYGIEKYQMEQISRTGFVYRYVGTLSKEEEKELLNRLSDCFGKEAEIKLENLPEIKSGKNGKYRTLVNRYKDCYIQRQGQFSESDMQ